MTAETTSYEVTPIQRDFWHHRVVKEGRMLKTLRARLGHKMTPVSREKLKIEIARTEGNLKRFHAYETGAKIPPQPNKEQNDMKETPRLIEIAVGPEPWRLMINAVDIHSIQYLPKFTKDPNGTVTGYDSFVVVLSVAGRVHEFPFNRAVDAQSFYEYVKQELANVGLTIRALAPTPIQPVIAANDETSADAELADRGETADVVGDDVVSDVEEAARDND